MFIEKVSFYLLFIKASFLLIISFVFSLFTLSEAFFLLSTKIFNFLSLKFGSVKNLLYLCTENESVSEQRERSVSETVCQRSGLTVSETNDQKI